MSFTSLVFKLSGDKAGVAQAWKALRTSKTPDNPNADEDDPTPVGKYLGCDHKFRTACCTQKDGSKKKIRILEYSMSEFCRSCADVYLELAGLKGRHSALRKIAAPFLSEASRDMGPSICHGQCPTCKARCCAPVKIEDSSGRVVPDPDAYVNDRSTGTMQRVAPRILMKMLYGARYVQHDLLCAVQRLACRLTTWDSECDRSLHRLLCYINSSLDLVLGQYVGDDIEDLSFHQFADADFAGCNKTNRSTSGACFMIRGPNAGFMTHAQCKRQACVSHGTPEAEIVADFALRTMCLPALALWECILGHTPKCAFHEDNEAMCRVCTTGRNPTMCHLPRTHRCSVSWLHEVFQNPNMELIHEGTSQQAADIFTKAFSNPDKWKHARDLVNMHDPSTKYWEHDEEPPPAAAPSPVHDGGNLTYEFPSSSATAHRTHHRKGPPWSQVAHRS